MVSGPRGRDVCMSGEGGGRGGGVEIGAMFRLTVSNGTVLATKLSLPIDVALPLNMFIKSPIDPPPLDPVLQRSLSKSVKLDPRRTRNRVPLERLNDRSFRTSASLAACTLRLRPIIVQVRQITAMGIRGLNIYT